MLEKSFFFFWLQIKHHSKVKLGCMLYKTMSAEEMVPFVLKKINTKLKFFRNRFLAPCLRRLLCNALIQSHFDYACSTWYSTLTKNWKNKIQTTQSKCICCFCLHLDKMTHISYNEFETLNWLPMAEKLNQCISSTVF